MKKEDRIGFQIKTLSHLIRRELDKSANKNKIDNLTGTHGWLIGYLYDNRDREIFQRDFETNFSIRRSTASNLLSNMENNGLIVREKVFADARLKKIVLTEKALKLHAMIEDDIQSLEDKLCGGLTPVEQAEFTRLCEKIKKNLLSEEKCDK